MERGFTLVEIAVVVLVLGLLLGSLLGPLSIRIEQQEIRKTSDQMEDIKEALYGYAMANGALPCPDANADVNGDGLADPLVATAASPCDTTEGWLPFQTLGVVPGDAWGFRFRYRVTREFTVANSLGCDDDNNEDPTKPPGNPTNPDGNLDLCDKGDIKVQTKGYTTPHPPMDLADDTPAVILSHGKNGLGATRTSSTCIPPISPGPPPEPDCMPSAPGNTDEQENTNPSRSAFISRHYTSFDATCNDTNNTAPYCEYDDILVWLSANILKYRLVQAGRLP